MPRRKPKIHVVVVEVGDNLFPTMDAVRRIVRNSVGRYVYNAYSYHQLNHLEVKDPRRIRAGRKSWLTRRRNLL